MLAPSDEDDALTVLAYYCTSPMHSDLVVLKRYEAMPKVLLSKDLAQRFQIVWSYTSRKVQDIVPSLTLFLSHFPGIRPSQDGLPRFGITDRHEM